MEKDKFDELMEEVLPKLKEEDFDVSDVEDFDAQPAMYQVWMLGYDENEAITDFEVLINESHDAEYAVEYAKKFVDEKRYETSRPFPPEVAYIEILVETVVDIEDYEENVGTLFTATVEI